MKFVNVFHTLLVAIAVSVATTAAQAQSSSAISSRPFEHLDLSLTAGTTGVGFDLAVPVNDMFQVRAGFSMMPRFEVDMNFGVQVGDDPATSQSKFDRLSGLLSGFTGHEISNSVTMTGRPVYYNFNLLLDVFPFEKKQWHFTTGFFLGNSCIADAVNTREDMQSLVSVGIYNRLYYCAVNDEPLIEEEDNIVYLEPDMANRFISYGRMGIHMGNYTHDITDADGNVIHHAGDPYLLEPNDFSMVKAKAYANRFKPYLGFGYGSELGKQGVAVSFDAGIMFWGGKPSIVTHDGTDLVNDVTNIGGKVGRYVDFFSSFRVFPMLSLRITKRLF